MTRHTYVGSPGAGVSAVGFEAEDAERSRWLSIRIAGEPLPPDHCIEPGCESPIFRGGARGRCHVHYMRHWRANRKAVRP